MDRPILYHALFSTCSQKVRYALAIKGVAYDSRIVDLGKSEHLTDAYLAINPNGVVPTLVHRGVSVVDSSVICEYLDEVFSTPPLSPADPLERARMRSWMRYFEEVTTPSIRPPSFNALFARSIAARGEAENARLRTRMPIRRQFYEKLGPDGFAPEIVAQAIASLEATLARVEAALADGGPFLLGTTMSSADLGLLPSIARMEDLGLDRMWRNRPGVRRWWGAMQAQPAFAATFVPGARLAPPSS